MSRSTIANRRTTHFDKETELRDYDAAAINATASATAIAFPATKQMAYKAVLNVAAYTDYTADTAQWSIAVEASADNSTFKPIGNAIVPTGAGGQFEIALEGAAVEDIVPGAAYVRVTATKTGLPGDLTYGAFLSSC